MPGFNIAGTGGEPRRNNAPNSLSEVRRTHRWLFTVLADLEPEVMVVLKDAQRPSLKFATPEMHHNQEQVYYAGKHTWDPIALVWYDYEQNPDVSKRIYKWINDNVLVIKDANVYAPSKYKKQARLEMVDGFGRPTDSWNLHNAWPAESNWNALTYTDSALQTINVTLKYDRAEKLDVA